VIFGNAEESLVFDDEHFSMVILMDILEYLNNPLQIVKESFRVLEKGGRIFAFAPDAQKGVWDDYSHKRPFSKKSLKRLFIDCGFSIVKISYEPVMPGVNRFCKFFNINKRPLIFWLLAKLSLFNRNVYIVAEKR
jgi:ubiquinone/menaquinone biosynthesis C-methylase UbiE